MRPMTWWEISGEWLGRYAWCQDCYGMRWFHRHRERPHPMLCFQHGGSEACEAENRKHGFTCPKCSNAPAHGREAYPAAGCSQEDHR